MKKKKDKESDEMRPDYDLTKLKFVGRGIYAGERGITSHREGSETASQAGTEGRDSVESDSSV